MGFVGPGEAAVVPEAAFDAGCAGRFPGTQQGPGQKQPFCHNVIPNGSAGDPPETAVQLGLADEKMMAQMLQTQRLR